MRESGRNRGLSGTRLSAASGPADHPDMGIGIGSAGGIDGLLTRVISQREKAIGGILERLSTGERINRPSDDPAGTAALSQLRADRAGIESKLTGLDRENARLAAEDAARGVMGELLTDFEGLTVQAANTGGLSDAERGALQTEAGGILEGLNSVIATTVIGGRQVFAGENLAQLGTEITSDGTTTSTGASLADIAGGGKLNFVDGDLEKAQDVVAAARQQISERRGAIGSAMKANEDRRAALLSEFENVSGAISQIGDADFGKEISRLTRERVLEKASVGAVLMARQQQSQTVLSLLESAGAGADG